MKTIRVSDETHARLTRARKTEVGTVTFDDLIGWLLDQAGVDL